MWCKVQMQTEKWRKSCFSFSRNPGSKSTGRSWAILVLELHKEATEKIFSSLHRSSPGSMFFAFLCLSQLFSKISHRFARAAFISTFTSLSPKLSRRKCNISAPRAHWAQLRAHLLHFTIRLDSTFGQFLGFWQIPSAKARPWVRIPPHNKRIPWLDFFTPSFSWFNNIF